MSIKDAKTSYGHDVKERREAAVKSTPAGERAASSDINKRQTEENKETDSSPGPDGEDRPITDPTKQVPWVPKGTRGYQVIKKMIEKKAERMAEEMKKEGKKAWEINEE